jgi:hypothetical protein
MRWRALSSEYPAPFRTGSYGLRLWFRLELLRAARAPGARNLSFTPDSESEVQMPRKPVPTLTRTIALPGLGKLTFEVTANPLGLDTSQRAMFNHVLTTLEAIETVAKDGVPAVPVAADDGGKTH